MWDAALMNEALAEARAALEAGEVPVGAVLADAQGRIIARDHNRRESDHDPTAHAEMLVLRAASRTLERWRLAGTTLYVTLEPCAMCAGALVLARVSRLVFAAPDERAGAVVSAFRIADDPRLNHRVIVSGGVEREPAESLLRQFFQAHRR
ncbi:MAG: tRNA adenosine(34) deaminase TadA [Clostridia bacterium]